MEAFDYLSVLISIVLGLGITQLLTGFGTWLEQRHRSKAYGVAIAWAGFLLLAHVQAGWTMFGMREFESWNFLQFTVVLMQPIVLFLLAVIVLPGPNAPQNDPRENFAAQRRWFFGLLIVVLVVSLLKDAVRMDLPEPANIAFHAVFFVIALLGFLSEGERMQRALAFGSFAVFAAYVALLFAEI